MENAKANCPIRATTNQNRAAALSDLSATELNSNRVVQTAVLMIVSPSASGEIFPAQSNRFAIPSQPHRGSKKYRGKRQPDPQPRAAQESPWCDLCQRDKRRIHWRSTRCPEGKSVPRAARQQIAEQMGEMRGFENNFLKRADSQWRQHRP